ncbi:FAD-dependent monooxygenase [Streptomyces lonarensis]|uniref:FAD-dependent monooxygenase n=1 Tax=Streptomyces lonarensis TaxID=700599 RepID=A0A7X6CYI9_9ACTN|nr:FAD-dependent monooxygenase [Streptomyces lonarensis]NJQ04835.1 FAD-dependent monooxygenase [Streptomyces lonarensis]
MARAPKILVAGAGIGGLAAAVTLRHVGARPHVFERAPELRAAGSGLGILSNASAALLELGVDLRLERYGQELRRFDISTWRGRLIRRMPTPDIATETGAPSVLIHRGDLLRALLDAAGDVPVTLGAQVVEHTVHPDGVEVRLADGTTAEGDALIGADGLYSAVRRQIAGPEPIREPGYINWLATVPFRHAAVPTGYCGHFWHRGRRFGLIDIGGGRVYWWATHNRPPEEARSWTGGRREIEELFRRFPEPVRAVIRSTPEEDILSVPARDRAFLENWGDGPVTLLGDAAHPMLTSLGQGAAMAVEDSAVLARCVATAPDVVSGLRAYERARRDRARLAVEASWQASRSEQAAGPLACALRNARLRRTPEEALREQTRALLVFPGLPPAADGAAVGSPAPASGVPRPTTTGS